jgi:hypothetical protein
MVVLVLTGISLITTLIGLYFVSEKQKSGFIYYTISIAVQGYIFIVEAKWLLVIQMVVLILSNIYVYLKWRSDDAIQCKESERS